MRRTGFLTILVGLALLAIACSQPATERRGFDVPAEVVADWINPTDVDALFPDGSGCLVVLGGGVRVLEVVEGSGAAGVLRPGDIIGSVDGTPTNSLEMLLGVLEDRAAGDVVQVEGTRSGAPLSFDIELSPVPGQPDRAVLGIISETRLDPTAPSDLRESDVADPSGWPVSLDGGVYVYEPLAGGWYSYPGKPAERMTILGTDLYAVATNETLSLERLGDGKPIPIDPGPVVYESGAGEIEVEASGFEAVLTSVGDLLLVAGEASAGVGNTAFAVHAVDPVEGTVVWTRPLGLSSEGNLLVAVDGYRSPSGDRALLTLAEHDPLSGSRSGVWTYYLVDEAGDGEVGPEGINRFLPTSGVTGWFDEESLLYVADLDIPQIAKWILGTGDHTIIGSVAAEDAFDLVTVTPVGDGRHVVQVLSDEVSLLNIDRPDMARPISKGCDQWQ